MKSLEDIIGEDTDAGRAFWDDCAAAFSAGPGARVLARLCELEHPLFPPLRSTVEGTHVAMGRKEVVALLWRRSQAAVLPQDAQGMGGG